MSAFRRSSVEIHLRQLQEIVQARRKADLAAEAAEAAKGAAVDVPPAKR